MKIMIIGSSGSGKSTFSREIGELLKLPVYHLDAYFWKPGWIQTPHEEWENFNTRLVTKEEWIIDGHYGRTVEIRMQAADVIIFFDLSPWITTYRVIKRRVQYHGKTRPDLNEGCPESLDWQFIKYGWNFRRDKRPGIIEKLKKHSSDSKIIIIKNRKESRLIIQALRSTGKSYLEDKENAPD
ncbi:DNA topology modulation protein [Paenibacillus anaericanus]|uniref:DNA topology modulation protein n=1 Tax=Paenibacillus anaericanus TaxID=170367 RepID=A0A3S1DM35_9BACL|nr:DNA topology modulation protein [Paenibacillus anaericanus]RUT44450.1 DNA topology modulation protein [Paenibacillus anaericanus]